MLTKRCFEGNQLFGGDLLGFVREGASRLLGERGPARGAKEMHGDKGQREDKVPGQRNPGRGRGRKGPGRQGASQATASLSFLFSSLFFFFAKPGHMEAPGPGIEPELLQRQCRILNCTAAGPPSLSFKKPLEGVQRRAGLI